MKNTTKPQLSKSVRNEAGFGLLDIIIAITVIAAVGIIGIVVALRIQQTRKPTDTSNSQANTQNQQQHDQETDLDPAVFQKYHSNVGGFTLHYPKSWIVQGIKGGVASTTLDGNEDQLKFQVAADTSKINNYGGTLKITAEAPGDEKWPIYPSGTIMDTFKNGISVWRDNQTQVLQQGRVANKCPTLRIATDKSDAFGFRLKNGKYISYIGNFCWAQGMTTTYTYSQQLESDEFAKTIDMIRSIKQD